VRAYEDRQPSAAWLNSCKNGIDLAEKSMVLEFATEIQYGIRLTRNGSLIAYMTLDFLRELHRSCTFVTQTETNNQYYDDEDEDDDENDDRPSVTILLHVCCCDPFFRQRLSEDNFRTYATMKATEDAIEFLNSKQQAFIRVLIKTSSDAWDFGTGLQVYPSNVILPYTGAPLPLIDDEGCVNNVGLPLAICEKDPVSVPLATVIDYYD